MTEYAYWQWNADCWWVGMENWNEWNGISWNTAG